jgi:hypothetical protein
VDPFVNKKIRGRKSPARGPSWFRPPLSEPESALARPFSQRLIILKGLSHEIFTIIFWLEWIYLGLNESRYWFLNFKDSSSLLDSYFKH